MKASSVIGIVIGMITIALGATMEGATSMAVLNPSAMLIVLGGTFGAVMTGTSMAAIKSIPKLFKKAFSAEPPDLNARVTELVGYAEQARRDGLLALDEQLASIEDPFTRKGLQLVVDGTDPDLVADVLEAENDAMRKRHAAGDAAVRQGRRLRADDGHHRHRLRPRPRAQQPEQAGDARPVDLGGFIATLLGIASANIVYPPDRRPAETAVRGGAALPRDDARGHPRDPGGRQPARGRREADGLRAAGRAPDRGARRPPRRAARPPKAEKAEAA